VGAKKAKMTILNRNDLCQSNFPFRKVSQSLNHDLLHLLDIWISFTCAMTYFIF
jgi:hypothetical protein